MGLFSFNRNNKNGAGDRPDPDALMEELTTAVMDNNLDGVRKVLDRAFWAKLEDVRPDGFHLLVAAQRDNRAMVQLLVTHGATWTREEAKIARLSIDEKKLAHLDMVLRAGNIDTKFTRNELRTVDLVTAMHWSWRAQGLTNGRALTDGGAGNIGPVLSGLLADAARTGLALAYSADKNADLRSLLRYRDSTLGDGTPARPLDVSGDFYRLLLVNSEDAALGFVDALRRHGLQIKPLRADGYAFTRKPGVVRGLAQRQMLAEENPRRMEMLVDWSMLDENVTLSGGLTIHHTPEYVADQHAAYATAVGILFTREKPASDQEAEKFIQLHHQRINIFPAALARMETELVRSGFFSGPAWTPQRLQQLADPAVQGSGISGVFNKMAAAKEIMSAGFDSFLGKKNFHRLADAIDKGAIVPDATQTLKILRYLKDQTRNDTVTDDAANTIRLLYERGANCAAVDPMEFMGKRAPGLAKTMLDTGLVYPESFDLQRVMSHTGGSLQLITPRDGKDYAYTEFACQLILEIAEPAKFAPLRGKAGTNYQQSFIKEWMSNLSLKNGLISYRLKTPGQKPAPAAPRNPFVDRYPPPPPPTRFKF